ncbi:AAA family ATPase [Acinetobacter pittii]|uniref:AAA family ATPase n=1 Tax=Acinetobacter pittii TaxID=48296 RepID=UPI0021CEA12E|nr:AAA family ATPase [Acinetobacter pittii]MCU4527095.1 AAA family ATPase [Acinetobacter pittii]
MIENIRISNYKSIKEMSFQPKRVNLFIGENGAGKSNILESLAIFSAATSNMLSNEFLSSRGIRPIDPLTTITKFSIDDEDNEDSNTKAEEKFSIFAQLNNFYIGVVAFHDKEDPYRQLKAEILTPRPDKEPASYVLSEESLTKKDSLLKNDLFKIFSEISKEFSEVENLNDLYNSEIYEKTKIQSPEKLQKLKDLRKDLFFVQRSMGLLNNLENKKVSKNNFVIFNPDTYVLMGGKGQSYIQPLGVNGEGLFTLLGVMAKTEPENFKDVLELASIFNWLEKIEINENINGEIEIVLKDRFMGDVIKPQNANEGFLFTLFYACLFCSNQTPEIFAVENIDKSLNPRLCQVLIRKLSDKAKKHKKQVFLSTHNPAVLDGINLLDPEETIFVVDRKYTGETRLRELTEKNIPKPKKDGEKVHLSEAFLRGYLGGLPSNF